MNVTDTTGSYTTDTCVLTACPGLHSTAGRLEFEPSTIQSQVRHPITGRGGAHSKGNETVCCSCDWHCASCVKGLCELGSAEPCHRGAEDPSQDRCRPELHRRSGVRDRALSTRDRRRRSRKCALSTLA